MHVDLSDSLEISRMGEKLHRKGICQSTTSHQMEKMMITIRRESKNEVQDKVKASFFFYQRSFLPSLSFDVI